MDLVEYSGIYSMIKACMPVTFIYISVGIMLEYNLSFLHIITGELFAYYWTYLIHRVHHILPRSGIFFYLNPHMSLHHEMVKVLPRWLELIVETLENLWWFIILYGIQELLDIHIVPRSILFLLAITYSSTHLINYSMFGSDRHRDHHIHKNVNYGPDFLDHVFHTNSGTDFEDMLHVIPNIILSFLITYWLFKL